METDIIDKLFLELSQVSKAHTRNELRLAQVLRYGLAFCGQRTAGQRTFKAKATALLGELGLSEE